MTDRDIEEIRALNEENEKAVDEFVVMLKREAATASVVMERPLDVSPQQWEKLLGKAEAIRDQKFDEVARKLKMLLRFDPKGEWKN